MKAYVTTTGVVFGLLTVAHIWRLSVEQHLASDPWYVAITVAAAVLSSWAFYVIRRSKK